MERKKTIKLRPHGEKKDYKAETPRREKKTTKLRPHGEKKKTTDEAKTPWRRERLQTKRRPHRKEKDYKVKTPWREKKTTDEAKTPRRRKRLQTKPKRHREEKDYKVETPQKRKDYRQSQNATVKKRLQRLQTKWRPYREEDDYRQGWDPTLLGLTQVDVDELGSPAVYQDVHHMAIAQSQDVAHWNTHNIQHPSTFDFTVLTLHSL